MTTKIRTLTVSRLYREWGEPHLKRECTVPSIRLSGKWLSRLGIAPGQKICVATNGATIILARIGIDATASEFEMRRRRPAVLQRESLASGNRTTRKCPVYNLTTKFGARIPRLIITRLSLCGWAHKSLTISACIYARSFIAGFNARR